MLMTRDEIAVGRERVRFELTSRESAGEVAVLDVRLPPGGGPPMLHRHDPFELYRVRSGELAVYLEDEHGAVSRTVAGPGTVIPIESGREHTVRNESDEDVEAVVVFSPGEAMEGFARAAGERPDDVLALAEEHGIEITRSIEDAMGSRGYLTIARFSGDGDRLLEDYRRSSEAMDGVGRDHGLVLHAGARTEDGFMVVNLWPSQEASEAAARDPRRLGVLERTGVAPDRIRREHHELARFVVFE
jgi:mannose-6-phosphate isomerase-like protein (cupin superfamily)